MRFELLDENVVVPANTFNPSVVGQAWLLRNEIVSEDDLRTGFLFNEVFSQVQTDRFELSIMQPRLQFKPKGAEEEKQALVIEKVGKIVRLLPHTPYVACGFNFVWHLVPDERDESIPAFSRRLFYRDNVFFTAFDRGTPRYGTYISCDTLDCRLKMDVKPLTMVALVPGERDREFEVLQFAFNYHLDVNDHPEAAAENIQAMLHRWGEAKQLTIDLLEPLLRF